MGAVPFRAAYQPQPSALKMKFLILACLVLSAVAKPEPQHETVGFTKHLNGAVVPVDTTSVLQQKALHGFKFPFYVRPAVAPVVKAVEPTIKAEVPTPVKVTPYAYPFATHATYPYTTYGYPYTYQVPHDSASKTAEVEKVVFPVVKTVPHFYGHPLTYPYTYNVPSVVAPETAEVKKVVTPAAYPYTYGAYPYTYAGYTGYPYTTHAYGTVERRP